MNLLKYKYQRIVGGVTWKDIEEKVDIFEMNFVVKSRELETKRENKEASKDNKD